MVNSDVKFAGSAHCMLLVFRSYQGCDARPRVSGSVWQPKPQAGPRASPEAVSGSVWQGHITWLLISFDINYAVVFARFWSHLPVPWAHSAELRYLRWGPQPCVCASAHDVQNSRALKQGAKNKLFNKRFGFLYLKF